VTQISGHLGSMIISDHLQW